MSTQNQDLAYAIAATALPAILIVPLGIIWGVSFCAVRNRNDPARRPFTWMKVAIPLIILSLFFDVGSYIVYIVEIGPLWDDGNWLPLDQVETRLFDVSNLIENVGHIFILFCLVDLGLSFLYVLNRNPKGHSIIRAVIAGLGVVLFALTVAYFGKTEALRTDYYNAANNASLYSDELPDYTTPYYLIELVAAFDILLWILSIAVFAFTNYILIISHATPQTRSNAVIYFVIGILYLLRNTWILVFDAKWLLSKNWPYIPIYTEVLFPILDPYVTFAVLVLVFVIGCRRRHGLWTTAVPSSRIFGGTQQQQPVQQQWGPPQPIVQQGPPVQYVQQVSHLQELK
ncbi:hypothetical protein L207DRAFT_445482 [Hyaloscypha variabilis F]|uniref:Uncharacterized protein n=1 Tax=Hyaloscypha variabilis (strain UAMH 11265 / GT02V1 / F) TaxID=1149755 RepID=A0A2J6QT42_HYAVF|nr:hypothetical protein L207DRAFT_445482 [Hyaloscypha variabilis F]